MKPKILILALSGLLLSGLAYANESANVVSNNIKDLTGQISQINQDLAVKQQKQQKINAAIKDSQNAISKSQALLAKLQKQRDADLAQLQQLSSAIPQMTDATNQAKNSVAQSIAQIYMQIKKIQDAEQTILSGNDSLTEQRKKAYLLELLNLEQTRYTQLNQKLTQQQALNTRLQAEVDRLNKAMGSKAQQHQQLIAEKESNLKQVIAVKQQIAQEKKQLNHLKQRQAELNQLLNKLADAERKQRQQQQAAAKKAAIAAAKNNNSTTNKPTTTIVAQQPVGNSNAGSGVALGKADNSSEDNSPFMSRKLVKPISGKILVSFGQMRDSVRNNGILLSASDNTPVYAVSRGSVLFSGELPGFGQIIVIDHGDNYTSVYSGVISKIGKGSSVGAGQQIATSGVEENQPMGGVYFELRHLGKPVNPSSLF